MPTLRLTKPRPFSPPSEEVPIKLESLPTPLRAVVRNQSESCLRIEAELPWLAIGTVVNVGSPEGGELTGRVQSFDVEVTSAGSARLVIFAGLSPAGPASGDETGTRPRRRARTGRWPLVLIAAFVIAAALSGYAFG